MYITSCRYTIHILLTILSLSQLFDLPTVNCAKLLGCFNIRPFSTLKIVVCVDKARLFDVD